MNENVRIRLSAGLIVVAIVHAVLLGLVFPTLYQQSTATPVDNGWKIPDYQPARPTAGQVEKLQQPHSVNLQAQGEIKQQRRILCPPCPPTNVVVQPSILSPTILPPTVVQPVPTPMPTPVPADDFSSQLWPAPSTPIAKPTAPPSKKLYQLALFVGNDAHSKQLQQWFEQHSGLAKLKGNCEFQVYTTSNAIYRARFSDIVPADQFPVVLFQDSTGGHVHAAGRTMIPATPDELYSDLWHGYELYMQAKQAQVTGAVKTRGYSWDDAITPALYLSAEDCPDGYCPNEPSDTWRPGDRVRDVLFPDNGDAHSGLLWVSAGEIATLALIVVAVILLGFILIKRGM